MKEREEREGGRRANYVLYIANILWYRRGGVEEGPQELAGWLILLLLSCTETSMSSAGAS